MILGAPLITYTTSGKSEVFQTFDAWKKEEGREEFPLAN